MRPLSLRERRLVAVLILLGAIALVWLAVVAPVLAGFAARAAQRDQLLIVYEHNLRTTASIPRLRRQAERQRAMIGDYLLDAPSVEAGRQLLKDRLQQAVERAGGEMREASDAEARPGWVRARVTARLRLDQLTELLERLQNDPPYLVIETLTAGADEALATGQPSPMDIQLEASVPLRAATAR